MKANERLYRDLIGVIDSIVMTDRSMKKNYYYKVVKMMCVISKDWFNDYETNLDSWPTNEQRTIKLFLSAYKGVIDRIDVVNKFNDLNSKGREFHELLRAVQDRLRNFGPIVEYPEKPRFALNDFIARWLRVFEFCFF
jgi:hypothetical protein